jgi:hypothetical protein
MNWQDIVRLAPPSWQARLQPVVAADTRQATANSRATGRRDASATNAHTVAWDIFED